MNISTQHLCTVENERYGSLDGLRAYAMICIVVMHVKAFLPYSRASVIGSFSSFVALFMMISAFSMCCGYFDRVKDGAIQPTKFYGRRYIRILPYFVFLCLLDFAASPSISAIYELFANSTLLFGLLPNSQMNMMGLGWFLGLIFIFYLIFPFFVFMIDNKRRAWLSLIVSIIFAVICIAYFYKPPFVENGQAPLSLHNIIYFMPFFVAGGCIYLNRIFIVSLGRSHTFALTVITVFLSVGYFVTVGYSQNFYLRFFLTLVIFSIWLIYAISTNGSFLNNKVTHFLSGISMEMYLAQMVVFRCVQMMHLERIILNETVLFVIVALLTVLMLIPFTYITKQYFVDKIVHRIVRKR